MSSAAAISHPQTSTAVAQYEARTTKHQAAHRPIAVAPPHLALVGQTIQVPTMSKLGTGTVLEKQPTRFMEVMSFAASYNAINTKQVITLLNSSRENMNNETLTLLTDTTKQLAKKIGHNDSPLYLSLTDTTDHWNGGFDLGVYLGAQECIEFLYIEAADELLTMWNHRFTSHLSRVLQLTHVDELVEMELEMATDMVGVEIKDVKADLVDILKCIDQQDHQTLVKLLDINENYVEAVEATNYLEDIVNLMGYVFDGEIEAPTFIQLLEELNEFICATPTLADNDRVQTLLAMLPDLIQYEANKDLISTILTPQGEVYFGSIFNLYSDLLDNRVGQLCDERYQHAMEASETGFLSVDINHPKAPFAIDLYVKCMTWLRVISDSQ